MHTFHDSERIHLFSAVWLRTDGLSTKPFEWYARPKTWVVYKSFLPVTKMQYEKLKMPWGCCISIKVASSKPERLVPFARIVEIIRWTFSSWVRTNLFLFLNLQLPGSMLTNNDDKRTDQELYPKIPSKFPARPSGLGYLFFFSWFVTSL